MNGQMSIFDFLPKPNVIPGEWITMDSGMIGERMTFDEITDSVGNLIVMDYSTESHAWYKVVLVEKIVSNEGERRLVYYDGCRQRGLVNERYFSDTYPFSKARAYRLNL